MHLAAPLLLNVIEKKGPFWRENSVMFLTIAFVRNVSALLNEPTWAQYASYVVEGDKFKCFVFFKIPSLTLPPTIVSASTPSEKVENKFADATIVLPC